jgi:undecaprenyl-diphosphatase
MSESALLLWIHRLATPALDSVFWFSHQLGTPWFCTALVLAAVSVSLLAKRRRAALVWALVGVSTFLLQAGLKLLFARPRPNLWVGEISHSTFAMPSGHALAAATFFPLLAYSAARRWPSVLRRLYSAAVAMAFYVGFGRLYLGVHWPTDVLVGWAIGAAQTAAAARLLGPQDAAGTPPRDGAAQAVPDH